MKQPPKVRRQNHLKAARSLDRSANQTTDPKLKKLIRKHSKNHKMVAKMLGRMNGRPGKKVVPPSQRRNADALFKDPIKIGSGPSFDEETYKKALPYFRAAAAHFKDAASDISQMVALMVRSLAKDYGFTIPQIRAMKPFLQRFIMDVKSGKETLDDVSDSSTDLESDSGNTDPADEMGSEGVSNGRPGNGRCPGSAGGQSAQSGNDQQGNSSVSAPDATIVGEIGNSAVSDGSKPGLGLDASGDGRGSDRDSVD